MTLDEICAKAKANIDRNKVEILALAARTEKPLAAKSGKRCLYVRMLDRLADYTIKNQDDDWS